MERERRVNNPCAHFTKHLQNLASERRKLVYVEGTLVCPLGLSEAGELRSFW